ncbi:MAG: hypothetical protein ABW202_08310 [Duganella sp.]
MLTFVALTDTEIPLREALKPWRSFTEQLQQLQDRGLQVDNQVAALDYLERLGYYRLSGYWYPLRAIDYAASAAQGKAAKKLITKGPDTGTGLAVQVPVYAEPRT